MGKAKRRKMARGYNLRFMWFTFLG